MIKELKSPTRALLMMYSLVITISLALLIKSMSNYANLNIINIYEYVEQHNIIQLANEKKIAFEVLANNEIKKEKTTYLLSILISIIALIVGVTGIFNEVEEKEEEKIYLLPENPSK